MDDMAHVSRAALVAVTALVPALLAVAPPGIAQAAAESCDGKQATIVGDGSRQRITGTEGPDVIISSGASWVDALGGDDTVCVTGTVSLDRPVKVFDGTGDDVVLNEATYVDRGDPSGSSLDVFLVEGDDRFVGNDTPEFVVGRSGRDTIETAGGADDVGIGSQEAGGPERPLFTGTVDVGDGGTVSVGPDTSTEVVLTSDDPTTSSILFAGEDTPGGPWSVDVPGGVITRDGVVQLRFEGFRSFSTYDDIERFTGSSEADSLFAPVDVRDADLGAGDDRVTARSVSGSVDLGEGDDSLRVSPPPDGQASRVDGGPGDDLITAENADGSVAVDLATGAVDFGHATGSFEATGFERAVAQAEKVTYAGTTGDDVIEVAACRAAIGAGNGADDVTVLPLFVVTDRGCPRASTLDLDLGGGDDRVGAFFADDSRTTGGGGDDRISAGGTVLAGAGNDRVRGFGATDGDVVRGGAGADVLRGRAGDDLLVGGSGRDTALGGPDADRCRAEMERSCER